MHLGREGEEDGGQLLLQENLTSCRCGLRVTIVKVRLTGGRSHKQEWTFCSSQQACDFRVFIFLSCAIEWILVCSHSAGFVQLFVCVCRGIVRYVYMSGAFPHIHPVRLRVTPLLPAPVFSHKSQDCSLSPPTTLFLIVFKVLTDKTFVSVVLSIWFILNKNFNKNILEEWMNGNFLLSVVVWF